MSDPCDLGSELEEKQRQWAIDDALRHTVETPLLDENYQRICRDCEEPIPLERLIAWPTAVRCISCQTDLEE